MDLNNHPLNFCPTGRTREREGVVEDEWVFTYGTQADFHWEWRPRVQQLG